MSGVTDYTAWLIEGPSRPEGATYLKVLDDGVVTWTTNPETALHLGRECDARAVADVLKIRPARISDHCWSGI